MIVFHVGFIIATVLVVLYADEQGLMWVLGRKPTLSHSRLKLLHTLVWIGLCGILTTGALLVWDGIAYYLTNPLFLAKMFFVLVLVLNTTIGQKV